MKTFTVKIAGNGMPAKDVLEAIYQCSPHLKREDIIVEEQ